MKCYSILTEEERKDLIRRAFELKNLLKDELQRTLDVIEKKNKELRKVHSQLEKGHLMVDGEEEAMEREELVYFPLFAEREFREGSAAQIHFRLAGEIYMKQSLLPFGPCLTLEHIAYSQWEYLAVRR